MNWARASGRTTAPPAATAAPLPVPVLVVMAASSGASAARAAAVRSRRPLLGDDGLGERLGAEERAQDVAGGRGDARAADERGDRDEHRLDLLHGDPGVGGDGQR